ACNLVGTTTSTDPSVKLRELVEDIAKKHRTKQVSICRNMQEPVALLRSGATIMFGGNREASCGDLIYLYTLAAPRLTKKLMTVASEN
ncbi:unnamed protein product, partial [Closterium sp. NIES-65]